MRRPVALVVDRELQLPLGNRPRLLRHYPRTLGFISGRISSKEIQIALDFPQHRDWVAVSTVVVAGYRGWARRQQADATLNFLVELGPPSYAITGADQRELSDRWLEGLQIREWVEAIWSDTPNGIA